MGKELYNLTVSALCSGDLRSTKRFYELLADVLQSIPDDEKQEQAA